MTITATRPTPLAQLEPGMVLRPPGDHDHPVDLTVENVTRALDGWTVMGRPVVPERVRRVSVTYKPDADATIVAGPDDLAKLRKWIAGAIDGKGGVEAQPSIDVAWLGPVLTLEVNGWEVTL